MIYTFNFFPSFGNPGNCKYSCKPTLKTFLVYFRHEGQLGHWHEVFKDRDLSRHRGRLLVAQDLEEGPHPQEGSGLGREGLSGRYDLEGGKYKHHKKKSVDIQVDFYRFELWSGVIKNWVNIFYRDLWSICINQSGQFSHLILWNQFNERLVFES